MIWSTSYFESKQVFFWFYYVFIYIITLDQITYLLNFRRVSCQSLKDASYRFCEMQILESSRFIGLFKTHTETKREGADVVSNIMYILILLRRYTNRSLKVYQMYTTKFQILIYERTTTFLPHFECWIKWWSVTLLGCHSLVALCHCCCTANWKII